MPGNINSHIFDAKIKIMETANTHYNKKKPGSGKQWAGLILLFLGVILLIRTLGGFIPDWIISFPTILIVLGIFSGMRNNFRNPGALILLFMGVILLAAKLIPGLDLGDFIFPVLIMGLGLYLILGRRKAERLKFRDRDRFGWDKRVHVPPTEENAQSGAAAEPLTDTGSTFTGNGPFSPGGENDPHAFREDYLDTVSVFGSIKKNIFSKNFRGGDIVTILGGAEVNLSQADIHGTVVIDVTQVFGGTKLIIPPQWKVTSDLAALFGGIEDKRPLIPAGNMAEGKVLILRGTSIFGGIDIRSF